MLNSVGVENAQYLTGCSQYPAGWDPLAVTFTEEGPTVPALKEEGRVVCSCCAWATQM